MTPPPRAGRIAKREARQLGLQRVRPRPLVASQVVKNTPRQMGGGRSRAALVKRAHESIAKGSKLSLIHI